MSNAFALALDHARQVQDKRLRRCPLPAPEVVRQGISRRPAKVVPFSPRPIAVLAPLPDTEATLQAFVVEEFREAGRKRETRS
jgi:hypothetical protein